MWFLLLIFIILGLILFCILEIVVELLFIVIVEILNFLFFKDLVILRVNVDFMVFELLLKFLLYL